MRRFALPMALLIAFALVAPVAAESKSATYQGEIDGGSFYCSTSTAPHDPIDPSPYKVTGTWTLNLGNDRTATVTVHAWYDGAHHMSTGHGQYQVEAEGGTVTMRLAIWTATFDPESGTFTWAADLSSYYQCPPPTPPAVVTPGHIAKLYDNLVYTGNTDQ